MSGLSVIGRRHYARDTVTHAHTRYGQYSTSRNCSDVTSQSWGLRKGFLAGSTLPPAFSLAIAPIVVNATLLVGSNIILESVLSFFGFGVQPPTSS